MEQTVTRSASQSGFDLKVVSNNAIDWNIDEGHLGWYFRLPESGERIIYNPIARAGRIMVTSLVNNFDPCAQATSGFTYLLSVNTGGALSETVFDLNEDKSFDVSDQISVGDDMHSPSGFHQSGAAASSSPRVLQVNGLESIIAGDVTGNINQITVAPSRNTQGRQSWMRIF